MPPLVLNDTFLANIHKISGSTILHDINYMDYGLEARQRV